MTSVKLEIIFAELYASEQSHYIEVAQEVIFMEQNMRFGLILGRLAILKKKVGGPIMSNLDIMRLPK